MTTRRLLLGPVFGAAIALALTTLPAAAQTVRHHDAVHDVVRTGGYTGKITPVPQRRQGDITWVRTTYTRGSLFMSMRFRALSKVDRTQWHYFAIRTSKGLERYAVVNSGKKYPHGTSALATKGGRFLHCRLRHRVSYRHNLVSVRVPARCLGRPASVRTGFGEASLPIDVLSPKPIFTDDGYLSGPMTQDSADVTYGPKVHRG